jgi:hypothetical protein
MTLSRKQLDAIIAGALPGEKLKEARALSGRRYALALAGGEDLELHTFQTRDDATTATAALRQLRAEIDLPIPQLRAADAEGSVVGVPYALVSEVHGQPLSQVAPNLTEQQLYTLGRRLGEIVYRIHRLAHDRYGALVGEDTDAAEEERSYGLTRLKRDLASCEKIGLLNRQLSDEIRQWFDERFLPIGKQPALIHCGLSPDTILARQTQGQWTISGVLGWEHAQGWSPAWEHVTLIEAVPGTTFFGLRVGYGNGYDENTKRAYEQVREQVMAPYRILLFVRRLWEAGASGAFDQTETYRSLLLSLLRRLANR